MAKIKFFKPRGQVPKGRKVKSIVGENYANNYKERQQKHTQIAHQNHKARVKAEEGGLLKNAKQEDDS